ncbi:MAG: hypothetical protein ACOC5T_09505 [Elusimicrobiota bacterium]
MGYPDIWGVNRNTAFMDFTNPNTMNLVKVHHRKPRGYTFDSVWKLEKSAYEMADELEKLGYKTIVIPEDNTWYVYRKKK